MRNKKAKKIKKMIPKDSEGRLDRKLYRKIKKHFKKGVKLNKLLNGKNKNM
jgi:hypothetical protein